MKARILLSLALASVLGFTACAGGTAPPGPTTPPAATDPASGLDGRTFLSTGATGATLVPGSQVRIAFAGGNIAANAGCNSMSGAYTIVGDRLDVGMLAMTEMACEEPLMAQDGWVAALLDGATIGLDGDTLTLAKDGVALTLQDREVADPDRPLLGTRWVVDGLVSGDAVSSIPQGVTAALVFAEGRVDVEAGCNTGSGTVSVDGATIAFGPIGLTKMACGEAAMAVEQAVIAVLRGEVGYAIEAGSLTLTSGATGLTLRAAP
jgi:heat shock protein HslJ